MKKAILYEKLAENRVRCQACNNYCLLEEGKRGICGVRQNIKGDLYLLVFNKAAAVNIDPIEKKPLFHFLPGTFSFSLGTLGCNFACDFCQNWEISQEIKKTVDIKNQILGAEWLPETIVNYCLKNKLPSISYTYNEPTIWMEYAYETMKLAKNKRIKNTWISNGFMSSKTLTLIAPYLDAINIDLKSFSEDFYSLICKGRLALVKKNIKEFWERGVWLEITTLIIPGLNDGNEELKKIAKFIADLSPNIPWHISAFYPSYKMLDYPPTPQETLIHAYQIGQKIGLKYIYTGNIPDTDYESTYCPQCRQLLIKRWGIEMLENNLDEDKCPACKEKIPGKWK